MIQIEFAERAKNILTTDENTLGLAVAGSWLTNELDEFSDLDLVLITKEKVSGDKNQMLGYANRLGNLLSGFTGEHVGEPRLLICLYDDPLLHVDIKFLTLEEFQSRIENPIILLDKEGQLQQVLDSTKPSYPSQDYQWIEDRFWTWIHYALLKIGRGEYFEALDFFSYLRMVVFGPLVQIKNGCLPRGMRKVEMYLLPEDLNNLQDTIPQYDKPSLLNSLRNSVSLYRSLRTQLFKDIQMRTAVEKRVMEYFSEIEKDRI